MVDRRTPLLLLLLLAACVAPEPDVIDVAPVLQESISVVTDGPAWVVLADKGPADDLDADLLEAELALHPRALARRIRNRPDGQVVDTSDLPVHPGYVQALEQLGVEVRRTSRRLNAVSVEELGGLHDLVAALPFVQAIVPVARREGPRLVTLGPAPDGARDAADDPGPSPYDYGDAAWQAELVNAHMLHGFGLTGQGVIVASTDTGFSLTHEVLAPLQPQVLDAWDFLEDDAEVGNETAQEEDDEQDFHGTIVVSALAGKLDGTMVGIAPEVSLLLAKTESVPLEQPFEEDVWVVGVEWAEQGGADVLTSSLGWTEWYDVDDMDGQTAVSSLFVDALVPATGLVMVVSAGNEGPSATSITAPADSEWLLATAAVDDTGELASFSGRGPTADGRVKPDLAGPGKDVTVVRWDQDTELRTASGTSLAAPILAGTCALLLEAHPEWTREQLFEALRSTASQATQPDYDLGWGIIDGWAACGLRCSCRDDDADGFYAADCGGDDCDDAAADRFPGQEEACNGIDDDCDGLVTDWEADLDGDGDPACETDCDDADPTVEGIDHDGDGVSLCDGDCADGDPSIFPGRAEIPYDGIDQDCDGQDLTDQDGDGVDGGPDGADCADDNPAIYPDPAPAEGDTATPTEGGHELCFDGRDNDCDGLVGPADPDCRYETSQAESTTSTVTTIGSSTCSMADRPSGGAALLLLLAAVLLRRRR